MGDESFEVIREITCSTCLSQNRRLFPIKDSNLFTMLNLNITVTDEDKMCWECRYAVMKMISFKNQAQKAKATLTALANKKKCNIQSLSRLSRSPEVKIIVLNESNDDGELICKEEPNSAEDMFEVVGNDNLFEHVDVEPYVEASVEDGTRNWLSECEMDVLETKHVTKKVNKTRTRKNQSYDSDDTDDTIFSVEKMTEKNMQQWRERKKEMGFYTDSTFKCTKCVEPMENITFYGAHKKIHTNKVYGKIICCVCMLRFPNDAALDLHSKTHYRLLKCKLCAHEWDSANGMRLHCREAHGVPVTAWGCELCPREFRSPNKLTVHMRCHRSLTCPECGITLRSSLKKHMNRQHPELPLRRCFICNQQFRGDSGLKVHMEKHINPVEDATFCVECNMEFRNKYVYRSHMRNTVRHAAAEDLRFKCPECGKGFLDHFSLTNHMDAMHDKRKKYKCESCGQAFTTVVARRNHKRRLHEGRLPPRDKICDYCGKAFQTRVILLQHVNSHTGARPYKCKLCDATFGYKSALYLHGRFVHKIKKKT